MNDEFDFEKLDDQLKEINAVPLENEDTAEAEAEEEDFLELEENKILKEILENPTMPVVDLTNSDEFVREDQPQQEEDQQPKQLGAEDIKRFYDTTIINYLCLVYDMSMDNIIIPVYTAALYAVGIKNPEAPYASVARSASIYAQQMLNQLMDVESYEVEEE